MESGNGANHSEHKHHILPDKMAYTVWGILLIGTVVTVLAAQVNLGALNFPLAMAIATFKAMMVILFFMGLKYDSNENRVIFFGSFIFVGIFMVLTLFDLFYRGDVYPKHGESFFTAQSGGGKFQKPWNSSPELVAHGKAVFETNCVVCHGANGNGEGPAAGGLNPKPRNFHEASGWKNGRKITEVFGTLTKGLDTMPSFGSLPADDRWGVVHYLLTFGPAVDAVTEADLKKAGVDPAGGGDAGQGKTLPVDFAIEQMVKEN